MDFLVRLVDKVSLHSHWLLVVLQLVGLEDLDGEDIALQLSKSVVMNKVILLCSLILECNDEVELERYPKQLMSKAQTCSSNCLITPLSPLTIRKL